MSMKRFVVCRVKKLKSNGGMVAAIRHNLRTPGTVVKGQVPARTHENITTGAADVGGLFSKIRERLKTATRKPRPGAVKLLEFVVSASPDLMATMTKEQQADYLRDGVEMIGAHVGAENLIGAYMHFDEKSPHIHIFAVPMHTEIRRTKHLEREVTTLNAKAYIGGRENLEALQTHAAEFLQGKGWDVVRGVSKRETNRLHVPLSVYHAQQRRDIDAMTAAAADHLDQAARENVRASKARRKVETEARAIAGFAASALSVNLAQQRRAAELDARAAGLEKWHAGLEQDAHVLEGIGLGLAAKRPDIAQMAPMGARANARAYLPSATPSLG